MINNHELRRYEYEFNKAKDANDFSLFEAFLKAERERTENELCCIITWQYSEIASIRPYWPHKIVRHALNHVAKILHDRSTEEGWEILQDVLCRQEKNYEKDVELDFEVSIQNYVREKVLEHHNEGDLSSFKNSSDFLTSVVTKISENEPDSWDIDDVASYLEKVWDELQSGELFKSPVQLT